MEFTILPANSCEENFAGLYEDPKQPESYVVVYSQTLGAPCKQFGQAREVTAHVELNMNFSKEDQYGLIRLNGTEFKYGWKVPGKEIYLERKAPFTKSE